MADAVVLITGASGAIGQAIALELARNGAHVAAHYHRDAAAAAAVAEAVRALGRKAIAVQADLGARNLPPGFMAAIGRELGDIDHLVYGAGLASGDMAAFMSMDDWDEVVSVNLRGALVVCQAVLPRMLRERRGSVVFVGSEAGVHGSPGLSAYAASKAGLVGFARSLAAEVGRRNVRVNVVSPGPIETELLADLPEERRRAIAERTALGRLGTVEEVARAVRFLLSDEAAYITGAVLPVNGGLGMF